MGGECCSYPILSFLKDSGVKGRIILTKTKTVLYKPYGLFFTREYAVLHPSKRAMFDKSRREWSSDMI